VHAGFERAADAAGDIEALSLFQAVGQRIT
jgi:hypothetical protein